MAADSMSLNSIRRGRASPAAGRYTLEAEFERFISVVNNYLAAYQEKAVSAFGSTALGLINLPSLGDQDIVAEQVKVASSLFWAKEVDKAGLPSFVERLVGIGSTTSHAGKRQLPAAWINFQFGRQASFLLRRYQRDAEQRFGPEERKVIYQQVFAEPFSQRFEMLVDALCEYGREAGFVPKRVEGISTIARDLAAQLSEKAAGIVPYAATDIVKNIVTTRKLLRRPDVRMALGGGAKTSVFSIIRRHAPLVTGGPVEPHTHLQRAKAGAAILAWLAGISGVLSRAGGLRLERNATVIRAAEQWKSLR